jgi:hypothetical protein
MADLTELREKVQEARDTHTHILGDIAFAASEHGLHAAMVGPLLAHREILDALLSAHRALCLAEAREAVELYHWPVGVLYDRVTARSVAQAAIDALQEGE